MSSMVPIESCGLPKMCRLCMREQYLEDVFKENNLHHWISNYLSITIFSVDPKGHSICTFCRLRLTEFHQYWTRCQEVQTILQSMARDQNETSTWLENKTELRKVKAEPSEQDDINYGTEELGSKTDTKSSVDSSSHGYFQQDIVNDHERETSFEMHHEAEENVQSIDKTDEVTIEHVKIESLVDDEEANDQSDLKISTKRKLPSVKTKSQVDQQVQCNQCEKIFPDRNTYRKHMRFHKPMNHCCHICGKPFFYRSTLEKHIPIHDPNRVRKPPPDKPSLAPGLYHCDICLKVFELKTRLWSHKTQRHRPKTHECHLCDSKFTMKFQLRRHIQKHYQESEKTNLTDNLLNPTQHPLLIKPSKPRNKRK